MAIVLGLPKGSLQESTFALFKRAGFNVSCSSRSYYPSIDDEEIKCRLLRPQEMSRYVKLGKIDAGICGFDWIYENGNVGKVEEICELNYSKATSNPVRWIVAVPNDSKIKSVKDLEGKTIATEAVGIVKNYLKKNKVKAEVEFSWGATEEKAPEQAAAKPQQSQPAQQGLAAQVHPAGLEVPRLLYLLWVLAGQCLLFRPVLPAHLLDQLGQWALLGLVLHQTGLRLHRHGHFEQLRQFLQ